MIVEVYPILKLPRKCGYFDYDSRLEFPLTSGDLVRVPFKGREVLGLVRAVKPGTEVKKIMRINSVAIKGYVSVLDIKRYEQLATCLVQSVSSVIASIFPTTFYDSEPPYINPDRASSISLLDIPILEHYLSEISLNQSLTICGERDLGFALAHALRRKRTGQLLILVPRERDADLLARFVPLGTSTSLLTGKVTSKDRARIFEAWRVGTLQTLIGTRTASFMPAHNLTTVLVLEAGHEEHINNRRNPRFDAREAVKLLVADSKTHIIFFDALPRLEELRHTSVVIPSNLAASEIVVNLASVDEQTHTPYLSASLIDAVEETLHHRKKVLILLNRTGTAKRLQCNKCGHIPLCGTCGHVPSVRQADLVCGHCQAEMWLPNNCPACGKTTLTLRGLGGDGLATMLRKLYPTSLVGQIEKGKIDSPEADIMIVTEYFFSSYLEPFSTNRFALVVNLVADLELHQGDFRSTENTARSLHRLINFAKRQNAQILIQTWLPDILRPLLDISAFIANELEIRARYYLPPFTSRYLLYDAQMTDLTSAQHSQAKQRDGFIELPGPQDLTTQSDSIKIQLDGPYVQSSASSP